VWPLRRGHSLEIEIEWHEQTLLQPDLICSRSADCLSHVARTTQCGRVAQQMMSHAELLLPPAFRLGTPLSPRLR
jgi:hypothetical protein